MIFKYDYLVIGSGVAGMSFALKVASPDHRVAIICKTSLEEANTYFAQGEWQVSQISKWTISTSIYTTLWWPATGCPIPPL